MEAADADRPTVPVPPTEHPMSEVLATETITTPHGPLVVLRFQRPAARNAMNTAMLVALLDALHDVEADDTVRGVLLAGTEGVFSAGADVKELAETDPAGVRRMELFTHVYERLTSLRHPTAAAVEGCAIGGGAEAMTACDLRVMGASSFVRFPGASMGLPVGPGRLTANVPLGTARDWVLSGRDVPADEALASGLAQRVVPDGTTEAVALEWLTLVASREPATVQLLKRMFLDFSRVADDTAWENDALRATVDAGGIPPGLDVDVPRTIRPRRR